ncbi:MULTISPECIES: protease modulator HflC [Sporosarcina]|uniref:Protein HflC n=3 Tax=Sporosarcina TaxID=1569 RepID=A0A1T4XQW1_9BACL|nr:FtsH protease regulator HflC [Sporosarcina newyorkensis 2681]MBY0222374.1 protease modulator HflC [Sporosarcina aquimarina]SKA91753.1 membrane protease subunit HflC [Sporosarcina newyorkensis]
MSNEQNPFKKIEEAMKKMSENEKNKTDQKRPATDPKVKVIKPKKTVNIKRYTKLIVMLTAAFAVLVILLSNLFIVKENEYRVVRQFGEITRIVKDPGINMKIPFIQSVSTLPKNQMTYNVQEAEITTKDKKRIIIDNYAVWHITDPAKMISNARNIVNAEARMEEFIYSVVRNEMGRLDYVDVVNDENSGRGSLNDRVTEKVNDFLAEGNFGIEVVDVRMKRIDLPEENEQSIYTRMISERQSTAQSYLSEGDAEKRKIEAETDREVQEMLAKAKKEAAIVTAQGEAEAAKIYNQAFSKDPEFYKLYRTLQSYSKVVNDETVIILPSDSPYAKLLTGYLQ